MPDPDDPPLSCGPESCVEKSAGPSGAAEAEASTSATDEVIPEGHLRLAEALIFASAQPVSLRQLGQILPDGIAVETVAAALRARYLGRGVELVEAAGGLMFRTAPDLAPALRKVVEVPRRLPRAAMETLAIIAYHQPTTRAEIEAMRGASLGQQTLEALLEAGLIAPAGHKEAPGRPTLWATTPAFLARFGLASLSDLPRRDDLLVDAGAPRPPASLEGLGEPGD
jgi:segregation and condensation protein B